MAKSGSSARTITMLPPSCDAVSACRFCLIEGLVCNLNKERRKRPKLGYLCGAAHTGSDDRLWIVFVRDLPLFQGAANLLGDRFCSGGIGARQNNNKLFAAITGQQVRGPMNAGSDRSGNLLKAVVSGNMTIPIVVSLELVDIDHEYGNCGVGTDGTEPLAFEELVEAPAIGDTRESVDACQAFHQSEGLAQVVFRSLAAGNIVQDMDEASRSAGLRVAMENQIGFQPEKSAVFLLAPVVQGIESPAGAALLVEPGHCVEIVGMNQLAVAEMKEFAPFPTEQLRYRGRNILAIPLKILEHDDVVRTFREKAKAQFAGSKVDFKTVSLRENHLHNVENDHADKGEELHDQGAWGEG